MSYRFVHRVSGKRGRREFWSFSGRKSIYKGKSSPEKVHHQLGNRIGTPKNIIHDSHVYIHVRCSYCTNHKLGLRSIARELYRCPISYNLAHAFQKKTIESFHCEPVGPLTNMGWGLDMLKCYHIMQLCHKNDK